MKKLLYCILFISLSLSFATHTGYGQSLNIFNFGAKGDAKTMNTVSIQKAIDSCALHGGSVVIPPGIFLTGTILLKSNVTLYLEEGAVLLGSKHKLDYKRNHKYALIIARDADHISITGKGTINGQGKDLAQDIIDGQENKNIRPDETYRPQLIEFFHCSNINVTEITLRNSSNWVQSYQECTDVKIDKIIVRSTAYWNNDGIDIVDCKNVRISNSSFDAADDGICLKSENALLRCENVEVSNCIIRSSASGFKLGTGSEGGFKNIKVDNLFVYDTFRSAVAIESVDGGIIEDVQINNIIGVNIGNPIFIRLGQRNTKRPPGSIRNILISNLKAQIPNAKPDIGYEVEGPNTKEIYNLLPSSIIGIPGHNPENITLKNINITYGGGARKDIAYRPIDNLNAIPERPEKYPEFSMLGELPAWGLYCRHAKNIKINNFFLKVIDTDYRNPFVFDDVSSIDLKQITVEGDGVKVPIVERKVIQTSFGGLKTIKISN